MLRLGFAVILALAALVAEGLSCMVYSSGAVPGWLGQLSGDAGSPALMLHGICAVFAALAALTLTRASSLTAGVTLFIFYSMIAGTLPVFGLVCLAVLAAMLSRPPASARLAEDRYLIGLPRLAAAAETAEIVTEPYATLIPRLDPGQVGRLLLGLRHMGGAPDFPELPLLRRFQSDPNPQLQFFAQGQLSSAQDELESALERAQAAENFLSVAEVHLLLARRCPPGDTHTRRLHAQASREALARCAPSALADDLTLQTALLLDDAAETKRLLKMAPDDSSTARARAEMLLATGQFSALRSHLASWRQSADPVLTEVASFWHSPAPSLS